MTVLIEKKENTQKHISKKLTARKVEYLALMALGFKNSEIAVCLGVAVSTVKKMMCAIKRFLNAYNSANVITLAFLHNYLTPEICNKVLEQYSTAKTIYEIHKAEIDLRYN